MDEPQASGAATEEPPAWKPDAATARVESPGRPVDPPPAADDRIDTGLGDPHEDQQEPAGAGGDDDSVAPDSSREVARRPYVVLEELPEVDGVRDYRVVGEVEASNGVHALRRAAKEHFPAGSSPMLVAVSARNLRAVPVAVSADTRVRVG